jgi:hypothetical protein
MLQTENSNWDELSKKIVEGINKGLRKLVETTAAEGGELVVSDGKGNPRSVPAKELLKNFPKA